MTLTGYGYDAFKVLAVAAPVAGFAAVAHVRAKRRGQQARRIESARRSCRSVFVDVPGRPGAAPDSVCFELTPQLLGWLAAAQSGSLKGIDTPDAVMLAFDVEAAWTGGRMAGAGDDSTSRSQLVATRERFFMRSVETGRSSCAISLRSMLDVHRSLPEGQPLYCSVDGLVGAHPVRRLRVEPAPAAKQFYWVRANSPALRSRRPPS
ncbi:hypothetical protein AB4Z46_24410 [Variovorax sp. M-6]|uniref:hypothetical protein n=1 Tax=Variovorax sp. M-6 TaxID=3233041 RepID=UPI003F978476